MIDRFDKGFLASIVGYSIISLFITLTPIFFFYVLSIYFSFIFIFFIFHIERNLDGYDIAICLIALLSAFGSYLINMITIHFLLWGILYLAFIIIIELTHRKNGKD